MYSNLNHTYFNTNFGDILSHLTKWQVFPIVNIHLTLCFVLPGPGEGLFIILGLPLLLLNLSIFKLAIIKHNQIIIFIDHPPESMRLPVCIYLPSIKNIALILQRNLVCHKSERMINFTFRVF